MCHQCGDEEELPEFSLEDIPEEEREEFLDYAVDQFHSIIEKAETHNILHDLIMDWPKAKQAMFTFAVVAENGLLNQQED